MLIDDKMDPGLVTLSCTMIPISQVMMGTRGFEMRSVNLKLFSSKNSLSSWSLRACLDLLIAQTVFRLQAGDDPTAAGSPVAVR